MTVYHPTHSQTIGFSECVTILGEMVVRAKQDAGIDPSQPLESLVGIMCDAWGGGGGGIPSPSILI